MTKHKVRTRRMIQNRMSAAYLNVLEGKYGMLAAVSTDIRNRIRHRNYRIWGRHI